MEASSCLSKRKVKASLSMCGGHRKIGYVRISTAERELGISDFTITKMRLSCVNCAIKSREIQRKREREE